MPEAVESFDFAPVYGPGKNGASNWRYDWSKLTSDGPWKCRPGVDFPPELTPDKFSKRVHMYARRHNKRARTQRGEDEVGPYLIVQFKTLAEMAGL